MEKLAAVVTLYNVDNEFLNRVDTYMTSKDISALVIEDNSPKANWKTIKLLKKKYSNRIVIHSHKNCGIAAALNSALKFCDGKYKWLLTMDQDSKFDKEEFYTYIRTLDELDSNAIGIFPTVISSNIQKSQDQLLVENGRCITSGMIVHVKKAIEIGGYLEDLFIDEVDYEFCLRAYNYGYYIYQYTKPIMYHRLGNKHKESIGKWMFTVVDESPLRQYYIMRNRLYIIKHYPRVRKQYFIDIFKWVLKIIIGENRKINKLLYSMLGIYDFICGRMGKKRSNQEYNIYHIFNFVRIFIKQGPISAVCFYWRVIHEIIFGLYHFHRFDIRINPSSYVAGEKYMIIGKSFKSMEGLWLAAIDGYQSEDGMQKFHPQLIIGDNVIVNQYVHIGCVNRIEIGNNVLMGSKIYITDHNHGVYRGDYPDSPDVPPVQRPLTEGKSVTIEDNVWIGEFCTILPGVTIGYGSIIGTHSTVTHDIPPCCIAVGSPARVIKRWDEVTKKWEKV